MVAMAAVNAPESMPWASGVENVQPRVGHFSEGGGGAGGGGGCAHAANTRHMPSTTAQRFAVTLVQGFTAHGGLGEWDRFSAVSKNYRVGTGCSPR